MKNCMSDFWCRHRKGQTGHTRHKRQILANSSLVWIYDFLAIQNFF
jgi:hypothetical protein